MACPAPSSVMSSPAIWIDSPDRSFESLQVLEAAVHVPIDAQSPPPGAVMHFVASLAHGPARAAAGLARARSAVKARQCVPLMRSGASLLLAHPGRDRSCRRVIARAAAAISSSIADEGDSWKVR